MTGTHDNHIVKLPFWVWVLKIVQGALAVIILGLAAYGVHWVAYNAWCLAIFTTLFTGILLGYYFLSTTLFKVAYNWIPIVVLESLAVIFWLCTFALLAELTAAGSLYYGNSYGISTSFDYDNYWKRDGSAHSFVKRDTFDGDTYFGVIAAGMTFALIEWLLFIVTLVMLALHVHRHRMAGHPIRYGGASTTRGDNENGAEKYEVQNIPPAAATGPAHGTHTESHQSYYSPQAPTPTHHYNGGQQGSVQPSPYPPPGQPAPYHQSISPPPPNTYEAPTY